MSATSTEFKTNFLQSKIDEAAARGGSVPRHAKGRREFVYRRDGVAAGAAAALAAENGGDVRGFDVKSLQSRLKGLGAYLPGLALPIGEQ